MATETTVSLKLHIVADNKKKNRVLFAEAGKDFVDCIFHILALPLGAIARIFSDTLNLGSIGSLHQGMNNLHPKCFVELPGKESLVNFVVNHAVAVGTGSKGGYVNGWVTFTVMDDLTVHASTADAVFSVLDGLPIKDVGAIEKRDVTFIFNVVQAIKLIKASLSSKTVLTDFFFADHEEAVVKAEKK